jgi:hypothetical protein
MLNTDELNRKILNPTENVNTLRGFEIIAEALVHTIYQVFGKNMSLNILYQIGAGPAEKIAQRIKKKYSKEKFKIIEAVGVVFEELKGFFSVQIKSIESDDIKIKIVLENHCFLREPIKNRDSLDFGKSFCRINKGYFETVFKRLLGEELKKIEVNFLENVEENNACIEEIIFYLK